MTTKSVVDDAATATMLRWGGDALSLSFFWDACTPVTLTAVSAGNGRTALVHRVPAVELVTTASGHLPASRRLVHTRVGSELRYVEHHEWSRGDVRGLSILQSVGGIRVRLDLEVRQGTSAVRVQTTVINVGTRPVVLRAVTSWSSGFTPAAVAGNSLAGWERLTGLSDWLGEGRWMRAPLRGPDFPELAENLTGHNPRGALVATSDGTWSTGHHLPMGVLHSQAHGFAVAWQIEHNGAWRWEIGEDTGGGYLALSGPTDIDSAWTRVLAPAESFITVPVTLAYGQDTTAAIAALTSHRRITRRPHLDNTAMPVVFNDYMNTLNGDPTTAKLLPLVDAAAEVGAEIFCIDAGWYDDSGHWWDTVGEWTPSQTRFPGGLGEVIDAIRAAGMVPGLWLEPEVVGVRSPLSNRLPDRAFLQRNGERIVEHDRYHLDLRHPAARAHLDGVVDRLVRDFNIGFFKFDYNINPGPGTDVDSDSVGDGLLEHNRAHLAWLDAVLDRHPGLVIENCASGAMRMDYAMLSRLAMQSTSDQQDFRKYPAIAASAPMSILPEQAASWAYPQPSMTAEEVSFCLVTGLLGRFYVSGHLNEMSNDQRAIVRTAIEVAQRLRHEIVDAYPHWPTGLPAWDDPWVSLGLHTAHGDELVSVWRRGASHNTTLHFPHLRGVDVDVSTLFPLDLSVWRTDWDAAAGTLTVHAGGASPAARTIRLTVRRKRSA